MLKRFYPALGLLFIPLLLLVPSCPQQRMDRGIKSSDQYWAETGLTSAELEGFLDEVSCYSQETLFLACVNSIDSMAERYNKTLGFDGQLKEILIQDLKLHLSEKKELLPWIQVFKNQNEYAKISFIEKWQEIKKNFIAAGEKSAVIALGMNGFLSVYKDPHTYIVPIAQYEEIIANSEARQDKVGFIFRLSAGRILVKKVFEGSASELAGLRKGDEILELNGKKADNLLPYQINEITKLKNLQRLSLLILRKGLKKYIEIIKTDTVFLSVTSKVLEGKKKLGLLMVHKFSKNSCQLAKRHLISLIEQGIQGVLLDVRDNPGGQLDEAACITNLFVKKDTILFETRYLDNTKEGELYRAEEDLVYSGPLVVLINSGSASASEILAGSLKDLNRATLVGEKTFGKGSFQDGHAWAGNAKVAYFQTEGLYYFPSGWTPQLIGLEPDIPVEFNNTDNQREAELFLNPIRPRAFWTGPQTLAWLNKSIPCDEGFVESEDPQLREASSWILCRRGESQ